MNLQQMRISKLVSYRSQLLRGGTGRAGRRLPGMTEDLRQWCHHSRSRRDFVLVMLEAKILGTPYDRSALQEILEVSRNTMVSIVAEAQSYNVLDKGAGDSLAAGSTFFDVYSDAYLKEWRLISVDASNHLSDAFQEMSSMVWDRGFEQAWAATRDLAILSRAGSVKATRSSRLTPQNNTGTLDLSSWVAMNSYNRDMLLLMMAAAIDESPVTQSQMMGALNVSRNSIKDSLRKGMAGGFIIRNPDGYLASQDALISYLQWHLDTFASYEDKYLAAIAEFHRGLHADKNK